MGRGNREEAPLTEYFSPTFLSDVVLTVVGVAFIIGSLVIWRSQQPIEGGVTTTGRVVDQVVRTRTDSDGNRRTDSYPIIEFSDQRERKHRFETNVSGFGGETGDVVQVRYDPSNPSRAQWADQPGQWLWIVVFIVGWIVLVAEVVRVVRRRLAARDKVTFLGLHGFSRR